MIDVLDLLATGLTVDEVLRDVPDPEPDDVRAALRYARLRVGHPTVAA